MKVGEARLQQSDVLIIGAGIAGLLLATSLRDKGVRVTVLESGDKEQKEEVHPLNATVQLGDRYLGASHGRFRALGGTSSRWGGALIPFSPSDFLPRQYVGFPGFPVSYGELIRYLPTVEKLFGIETGSYDDDFVKEIRATTCIPTGDSEFKTRFAKWPPFKKRNLASIFAKRIETDPDLVVWVNATATEFNTNNETGELRSVTARCKGSASITVDAPIMVICAGAIESTRLLLLLDINRNSRIFFGCTALGRYFSDHMSLPVAHIEAKDVNKLNRLAGLRFVGSSMRSVRFELAEGVQKKERVPNAFGHISFRALQKSGFDVLRDFLRARQRGIAGSSGTYQDALQALPYFAKLAWWRGIHKQLAWPTPAAYDLHVVAEQLPKFDSRITLVSNTDIFGLQLAGIQWSISSADLETFKVFTRYFERFWHRYELDKIGHLNWRDSTHGSDAQSADVYHPSGSTRMGLDGRSAVVDADLKSFHVKNLWVASTSTFPAGGGENPTLMLMLFVFRLSEHLAAIHRRRKDFPAVSLELAC